MAWFYLLLAGLCEMVWPIGFKHSHGFTKLWPTVGTCLIMLLSFWLMSLACKTIHLGTAYAVWTGLGAAGTAVIGIYLFQEPRDFLRLACLFLILVGVVGLKFSSPPT